MKLTKLLSILILGLGLCLASCGDPCDDVACQNGGTCIEGDCSCPSGFSGTTCQIEDLCITQPINCQNGGTCVNGSCDCPAGYTGTNCQSFDINEVQALLDAGETPLTLYNSGIPLSNLYGKTYQGGLIFYLNTNTGTGLVAAPSDQGDAGWGCEEIDIPNLYNVEDAVEPPQAETFPGARIGDGNANTDAILAGCNQGGIAARQCRDLGPTWFLPSRGELYLMYINLRANGHGGLNGDIYWSSTEGQFSFGTGSAWFVLFEGGFAGNSLQGPKDGNVIAVRAAKAF